MEEIPWNARDYIETGARFSSRAQTARLAGVAGHGEDKYTHNAQLRTPVLVPEGADTRILIPKKVNPPLSSRV